MGKRFSESAGNKPAGLTSPGTFRRNGITIDVELQCLRIRNHCYAEPVVKAKTSEVTMKDGTSAVFLSLEEEDRCPANECNCEIYQDHLALGMNPEMLPCKGAPIANETLKIPGEQGTEDWTYDEAQAREDIIAMLSSANLMEV